MAPAETTILLRDGRRLGYLDAGPAGAPPIFYLNGTLGSRLEIALFQEDAVRLGLRMIGVDRPGHGLSTPLRVPSFSSSAQDLAELADQLQLARFGLMGWSGGGGHAACAASVLADRVTRVALLCPVGKPRTTSAVPGRAFAVRWVMGAATLTVIPAWLLAWYLVTLLRLLGDRVLRLARYGTSPGDAAAVERVGFRKALQASWLEGARQGSLSAARDVTLQARGWDVALRDPGCPVDLWFGERDTTHPPAIGRENQALYAQATLRVLPGEGHLLVANHAAEILAPFADQ